MTNFERWQLVTALFGTAVNLLLFVFVIVQVRLLRRQVDEAAASVKLDHDRRKMESTLDFYASTIDRRNAFREVLPNDRDTEGISALVDRVTKEDINSPMNRTLGDYMNYFELLAVGVNMEIYDYDTVSRLAGGRLIAVMANYGLWVDHRRAALGSATLWGEFADLTERLRNERAQHHE